jgi:hypothetical protein
MNYGINLNIEGIGMTDEWLYLDDPEIRFQVSNEAVLDDYGTRLVDLCKSGDDEGFLSLFAELEAFCRAGGEDGERYWEWYYAGDDRADTARFGST